MASSLFGKTQVNSGTSNANNMLERVSQIRSMVNSSGNPNGVVSQLMKVNPQFAKFFNDNKDKSVEQICSENGVDHDAFKEALGRSE